jgi:hypothetical protein
MLDKIPLHHRLAVYLGLVEIGLGGVFHSLRIPCTGYALSLHQIFCLNRAVRDTCDVFAPIKISLAAGFFKISLPSTKTLTPFVAIVMQGILFNVGILLFGRTIVGRCVGAMLSCVWGFIQPLLIIGLVLRKPLMDGLSVINIVTQQWHINLFAVILFVILLKVIFAIGICFYAVRMPSDQWSGIQDRLFALIQRTPFARTKGGINITSFFNMWFIIPMALSITGLLATNGVLIDGLKSASQGIVLYMMIIVGINLIPMNKAIKYLTQKKYQWLAEPCAYGINLLKGMEKKK